MQDEHYLKRAMQWKLEFFNAITNDSPTTSFSVSIRLLLSRDMELNRLHRPGAAAQLAAVTAGAAQCRFSDHPQHSRATLSFPTWLAIRRPVPAARLAAVGASEGAAQRHVPAMPPEGRLPWRHAHEEAGRRHHPQVRCHNMMMYID